MCRIFKNSVYVDLQYDEISHFYCWVFVMSVIAWSVCEVVLIPYVDAVVTVAVMRVLFFCIACVYAERVRG